MSQIAARGAGLMAAPLPVFATVASGVAAEAATTGLDVVAAEAAATNSRIVARVVEPAPASVTAAATEVAPAKTTAAAAPGPALVAAASAATVPMPARAVGTTTAHLGAPVPFAKAPSAAGSIGGAVFALIVVIGLIFALAWLAKRMPGLGGNSNPSLRIIGSLALGPRERVVVVAVGDTQLLLGVGANGTRTLHTLTEPLPVATATTPAFAQLLAQHFGKKA